MCEIRLGPDMFRGVVIDFSPEGVGVLMNNESQIVTGALADVKLLDYDIELKSKIVWAEELGYHVRIGFRNLGSMNGKLKHYKLADVLIAISRSKKTGTLEITTGSITKKIYILNGSKIFAASTNTKDRLGEYLVKQGKITPVELKEADALVSRKGQRLGKILLDLGYLKEADLYKAVQNQVEGIIISLFNIEEGLFEFKEGPLPSEEPITLQISSANLIYKGIKQINNVTFVQKMCPPLYTILNISQSPLAMFRALTLEHSDKLIFSHINGINSLQKVISLSPLTKFETIKTIITFLSVGIIHIKDDYEEPAELPYEVIFSESEEETVIEESKDLEEIIMPAEAVELIEEEADEESPVLAEDDSADAEEIMSPYAFNYEDINDGNEKSDTDITASPEEATVIEESKDQEETIIPAEAVELIEEEADEESPVLAENDSADAEKIMSPYAFDSEDINDGNEKSDADITASPEEETVIEESKELEETIMPAEAVELIEEEAYEESPVIAEGESTDAEEFISPYAFDSEEINAGNDKLVSDITGPPEEELVGVAADNTAVSEKTGAGKKYVMVLFIIIIGISMPFIYDNIRTSFSPSLKLTDAIVVAEKESTTLSVVTKNVSYPSFHDMALAKLSRGTSAPYPEFHKMALRKLLSE